MKIQEIQKKYWGIVNRACRKQKLDPVSEIKIDGENSVRKFIQVPVVLLQQMASTTNTNIDVPPRSVNHHLYMRSPWQNATWKNQYQNYITRNQQDLTV